MHLWMQQRTRTPPSTYLITPPLFQTTLCLSSRLNAVVCLRLSVKHLWDSMSFTVEIQVTAMLLWHTKDCDLRCTTKTSLHGLATKGFNFFPSTAETSILVWDFFRLYQGKDVEQRGEGEKYFRLKAVSVPDYALQQAKTRVMKLL